MAEYTKEYFQKLARDIMFELSDEEAQELLKDFEDLGAQIAALEAIDTDGVEEMVYPFEAATQFLRDDETKRTISQEDALANAKSVKAGHVHVPKVVK